MSALARRCTATESIKAGGRDLRQCCGRVNRVDITDERNDLPPTNLAVLTASAAASSTSLLHASVRTRNAMPLIPTVGCMPID
jgi:hypothetical protein